MAGSISIPLRHTYRVKVDEPLEAGAVLLLTVNKETNEPIECNAYTVATQKLIGEQVAARYEALAEDFAWRFSKASEEAALLRKRALEAQLCGLEMLVTLLDGDSHLNISSRLRSKRRERAQGLLRYWMRKSLEELLAIDPGNRLAKRLFPDGLSGG